MANDLKKISGNLNYWETRIEGTCFGAFKNYVDRKG